MLGYAGGESRFCHQTCRKQDKERTGKEEFRGKLEESSKLF